MPDRLKDQDERQDDDTKQGATARGKKKRAIEIAPRVVNKRRSKREHIEKMTSSVNDDFNKRFASAGKMSPDNCTNPLGISSRRFMSRDEPRMATGRL